MPGTIPRARSERFRSWDSWRAHGAIPTTVLQPRARNESAALDNNV